MPGTHETNGEYQGLLLQVPMPVLLLEAPKPRPRTAAVGFQIENKPWGPRIGGGETNVYFWEDGNGDHIRVHTDVTRTSLERLVSLLNHYRAFGMATITVRVNGWYADIKQPKKATRTERR